MEPESIFALAAAPGARVCYAATGAGLWQLNSKGKWRQIAPQFAPVTLTSVVAQGSTVIIGASGDIAVSRDKGESFGLATLPVRAQVLALALSPSFEQDGVVLAATAQDGVLRSTNGGASFFAWNFGLLDLHVNALAFSPQFGDDNTVFAATDHAVFISLNGGRAWRELPVPADAAPFTSLVVDDARTLFIGTEGHGLWQCPAPHSDVERIQAFKPAEVNAMCGGPLAVATTDGIYVLNGKRWQRAGAETDAVCLTRNGALLLAGTVQNGVRTIG
jgi:photosystem II stability/assembly factor-like uncharacterized protein